MKNPSLKNKRVLLGVSGGIAAYKSVELVRRLKDSGASVSVVMTEAARRFVTPLTFEAVSRSKVHSSLFDEPLVHIALPSEADLLIVAPATANTIGKFSNGIADDLLSACFLSCAGKTLIAPAMNWRMYENPAVRENLARLASRGVLQVGPEPGSLACGEEGPGRMAEVQEIIEAARAALADKDLRGERVVVTAGPTREYLDPVRFLSNRSSGKMGYALARAARDRGAGVTLISGPTALPRPSGMDFVAVEDSAGMLEAVQREVSQGATVLIMAAAVADYAPAERSAGKREKSRDLSLELKAAPDIISTVAKASRRPFIIGFAAETGGNTGRAAEKMKKKGMDMIVFNDVTEPGAGFDTDTNKVVILDGNRETHVGLMPKYDTAHAILDRLFEMKT
ncbi:MAG: bifunctional phosphopantothenoylcysteine decarboxylase/phosphopantothenate--cysteine ligase CoaBC [Nitrospiraceae bacterium]|nr:bifunctional phosphopantothenoylcysteine decarboxylase/phosphopantothenate--cysteine ligase CoaBC [Nitrospiraceae bacterium]